MQQNHSDKSAAKDTQQPSGPYGRACAGCSKAKCKCVRDVGASGAACQRCQRLGRPCQPSRVARKRGGGRPPNRTAHLEEKLESIVTLLRSQGQPAPNADTNRVELATPGSLPLTSSLAEPVTNALLLHPEDAHECAASSSATSSYLYNSSTPSTTTSYSSLSDIDPFQAEESLQLFRSTYLVAFPLVYIPSTTTAAQLRVQMPHLWFAIQSVCCKPFSARAPRQETLRRVFAERVLVNFECDMDLLLGQLVFATWGNTTTGSRRAFHMSAVVAATLAQDLKLDRGHGPERGSFEAFAYGLNPPSVPVEPDSGQPLLAQTERTNEERRAVLASFCLSSSNFHKLGTPPMRWTSHMNDSLRQLAIQPECENDEVLVVLTKCSSILNDIFSSSTWGYGDRQAYSRPHRPAPLILIKALTGALEEVRQNIRPPLLEKSAVKFWLLVTEVLIFDLALQSPGSSPSTNLAFTRAEYLQCCLASINHFFEDFAAFKPQEYVGLHVHYWLQFMRCTRIVYRLLLIEDAAWDSKTVRESVDLMAWLQRGAEICQAVPAAAGLDTDGHDGYSNLATNLQLAKSIWTKTLEQAGVWPTSAGTADQVHPDASASFPDNFYSLDIYDDSWMASVIF